MVGKNPILKDIIEFLEFLQREDSYPKKRMKIYILYGTNRRKNIERIIELCNDGEYIKENKVENEYPEKNGKIEIEYTKDTYGITIKGIEFLEKHKEIKNQKEIQKSQNILTFALFGIALFQGAIFLIYYCFDLIIREFAKMAWVLALSGIFLLVAILKIFNKMTK